jgi:hypothetical protein
MGGGDYALINKLSETLNRSYKTPLYPKSPPPVLLSLSAQVG